MTNLVDTILSSLPANTGDALGTVFGENPEATFTGLSAILPILLGLFAGKAAAGSNIGEYHSAISAALAGGNPLDKPALLFTADAPAGAIGGLGSRLLGENSGPIISAVSQMFGLKAGTVQSLVALAGPMIAGGIARHLGGMPTMEKLQNLLVTEKSSYEELLPTGLRRLVAPVAPPPISAAPAREDDNPAKSGWLLKWLAPGVLLVGLLWYAFDRETPAPQSEMATIEPAVEEVVVAPPPAVAPAGAGIIAEERDGRPLLLVFFDVGKSEVSTDLAVASTSVKTYLDSNPAARLSVSGYNDPSGDAAANAALSKQRAERVKAALAESGIAADRIDLDKPAETTDASESYAAARRVEVKVKE